MMANITFLSFLLFSMCHFIHVAVNTWLNCSFYINHTKQRQGGICRGDVSYSLDFDVLPTKVEFCVHGWDAFDSPD